MEIRGMHDIEKAIQRQEERDLFWTVFAKLSPKEQKLLLLSFEGYSSEEIRQEMNDKSVSYTRKLICEARKKLIKLIKGDDRYDGPDK